MEGKTYTIDASGKTLGRLAVQVALLLRGKKKAGFVLNKDVGDFVIIKNVGKMVVSGKKMVQKKYFHHTEYLGGLKQVSLRKLFEKDPSIVLRKAVIGMLPDNKLARSQMKRLKIIQNN